MATSPETPTQRADRKNVWDVVLTSTPVVLTVIGTLLAGLANSEMTQAQYRRSLAAQYQSKTSDQWGFFQAKRIRGTMLEVAHAHAPAMSTAGEWGPDRLLLAADRLAAARRLTARQLQVVRDAAKGAESAALLKALESVGKPSEGETTGAKSFAETLKQADAAKFFEYLGVDKLPAPPTLPTPTPGPSQDFIAGALLDVKANKPEEATAERLAKLNPDDVRKAVQASIDLYEARAAEFDDLVKPVQTFLRNVDKGAAAQLGEARRTHRSFLEVDGAAADLADEARQPLDKGLAALRDANRALGEAADDFKLAVRAVREDFDTRRYSAEATYNQAIAQHYEVMVRLQGALSERHRGRSRQFFYGMLCAQAGVAIGSTALAARHKSVLWFLAGLAGTAALLFSLYVYVWV